jgi:hypothetical protein
MVMLLIKILFISVSIRYQLEGLELAVLEQSE